MSAKYRELREESVDIFPPPEKANTKWQSIWRGINLIMVVFFGLATLANVNDEDWYLWVPIYLVPTLLCLRVVIDPANSETMSWKYVATAHFILCLAYAVYLLATVVEFVYGKRVNPLQHEEGREFFGLVIVMGWLAVCRFTPFGRSTSTKGMVNAMLLMMVILAILPLVFWSFCMVDDWSRKLGHCNGMFTKKEL